MKLADTKKLKPGDVVRFGDTQNTRDCIRVEEGTVVFVTSRGGVRLKPQRSAEKWVPYHHLIRKLSR